MKHAVQSLLLCFAALFLVFSSVNAARSVSITADRTSLLGEEELTITASPSGFIDGETVYIKGAFFQNGSSNYFGFTKSGDAWIKNSSSNTSQRSIQIGEWDGTLTVKSDFGDSGYKGEGDYLVKIGFYYGSATSVNWSANSLAIGVNEPDPTPTHTPTPTLSPNPTPQPTVTPTPFITVGASSLTPTRPSTPTPTFALGDVLSATSEATGATSQLYERVSVATESPSVFFPLKPVIISFLFISCGLALLSGVLVWQKHNELHH